MSAPVPDQSGPSDDDLVPAYGGSADRGVRESVPDDDPMAGDVVSVLQAEHRKLYDLFGEMVALLDAGDVAAVRERWFGVVRETLEFLAGSERVVVPAVADGGQGADARSVLRERLTAYDELNPDIDPDDVRDVATTAVQTLREQEQQLLPRLRELDATERDRLGEDLRQVMG